MMTKEREKSGDVEKKKKDPRTHKVRVHILSGTGIPAAGIPDCCFNPGRYRYKIQIKIFIFRLTYTANKQNMTSNIT